MITRQRIQGYTCYDITVDAFENKGTVPIGFRTELILYDSAAPVPSVVEALKSSRPVS
jgi:hypothetical protein